MLLFNVKLGGTTKMNRTFVLLLGWSTVFCMLIRRDSMFSKIAFIGAGSMAEAIIAGITKQEVLQNDRIFVTNKNNQERLIKIHKEFNVQCLYDKNEVIRGAEVVILSMKPSDVTEAVQTIKPFMRPNQLVISVVAGVSTKYISELLGEAFPVIRAMPNTSASIGYSATAIAKGDNATNEHILMAEPLFQAIGMTTIVDEQDMHIVTGISGSGPAYIYYLVEAMEQAAIDSGLDRSVAKSLITQTVIGAGKMLEQTNEQTKTLRKNITSPAGTTEAGIKALTKYNFQEAVIECVYSARDRSIELGKSK